MLPSWFLFLENGPTWRLLAILEEWDKASGQHTDNTKQYCMVLFIKFGLEIAVFYACNPKKYKYFLSIFGLSIVLADFLLACLMGAALVLGAEKSLASPCFLLASASTAYGALPLPIMLLGFVDYCLDDILMCNHSVFWKTLRNAILTLLVWVVAVNYSLHSSYVGPVELEPIAGKVLVCEVTESTIISAFVLGLFIVSLLTLVKLYLKISSMRPPLWFSMMLGFLLFWMPYLLMSVACMIFGFGLPAYLGFNLLWFECSNSLLVGLVFWAKSNTKGPYSNLPENVCLWQVCWSLSRDIQRSLVHFLSFEAHKG
uniref:Uncharacterized LOC107086627 n=1 Tax=Cyprinodon variegatus TaxID=28743 RepID=A0A3Q2C9B9_CYPVA